MDAFIAALRDTANVRHACSKADISRTTAYQWRNKWSTFAARWDDALEDACDQLELVARARATRAINPSDRLLVLLLAAHRPEKYGKQRIEHSGPGGGAIGVKHEYSDNAIADILSVLAGTGALDSSAETDGEAEAQ